MDCVGCGLPFERSPHIRGRKPRYCSKACCDRASGARRRQACVCGASCNRKAGRCLSCHRRRGRQRRACLDCGGSVSAGARRCHRCEAARRRPGEQTCRYCLRLFVPRGKAYGKYCSREHAFAYWHEHGRPTGRPARVRPPRPVHRFRCVMCGDEVVGGRSRKYCTRPRCRNHWAFGQARQFRCRACGVAVSTVAGSKRRHYCSPACARWYASARTRWFADWPTEEPIPLELILPRRAYGRAKWFLNVGLREGDHVRA